MTSAIPVQRCTNSSELTSQLGAGHYVDFKYILQVVNNIHYCEDRFYIRFFNRSAHT